MEVFANVSHFQTWISSSHTRILAGYFKGLIPHQAVNSKLWDPVEFDEMTLTLRVDESKCIDPKALHHAIRARDTAVGHCPHDHMGG